MASPYCPELEISALKKEIQNLKFAASEDERMRKRLAYELQPLPTKISRLELDVMKCLERQTGIGELTREVDALKSEVATLKKLVEQVSPPQPRDFNTMPLTAQEIFDRTPKDKFDDTGYVFKPTRKQPNKEYDASIPEDDWPNRAGVVPPFSFGAPSVQIATQKELTKEEIDKYYDKYVKQPADDAWKNRPTLPGTIGGHPIPDFGAPAPTESKTVPF